jgi:pimeloyl-ACP methyl ester carboxylesterase
VIAADTSWTGTYTLPASAAPVAIVVRLNGRSATVALGPGHSGATQVSVSIRGRRVGFAYPGIPQNVIFGGELRGARLAGTVRQGALRGRFSLRRGLARIVSLLGAYRSTAGAEAAVVEPLGVPPILVELPSGETHGIGPSLTVGRRLGDHSGHGRLVPEATGFTWHGAHYTRVALRQREVRVGIDAATLTVPAGPGLYAAVAMVHGSGMSTRSEFDVFTAYLALHGIAVLADDKRGVGESGGTYPGDLSSGATIGILAADAQREVRFLAQIPGVDPARIGLFGDSQAGWIVPLAAAHDPTVRWAVLNSGPTTTVGETDLWASLAGQSETPPSGTRAAMLTQVRAAGPSGFDPLPTLRQLQIPVLWLYGSDDRNVPTELCLERLQPLESSHDFSTVVLPTTHAPLILPTGLLSSLPRSPGFDPRFFPSLGDWLRKHGLARA